MDDWREARDFTEAAKPGDAVEAEIVNEFINDLPPVTCTGKIVQAGEAYSRAYDVSRERWRDTYITFAKRYGRWIYCGLCFLGETREPLEIRRRFA